MDRSEARSLLALHRAGETAEDARFAEALRLAASDPELALWWAQEQELDRTIAEKLRQVADPADLQSRLPAREISSLVPHHGWRRGLLLAAAAIVVLAVFFGSWRGPFESAVSLADYRDEMVSFVKMSPPLELETADLLRLTNYLQKESAPVPATIPVKLRELEPIGCRVLRFRGEDVSLICFKRGDGRRIHLFVLSKSALQQLPQNGRRNYAKEGEWMTATWLKGDQAYLLAVQGDRVEAEKYLVTAFRAGPASRRG